MLDFAATLTESTGAGTLSDLCARMRWAEFMLWAEIYGRRRERNEEARRLAEARAMRARSIRGY